MQAGRDFIKSNLSITEIVANEGHLTTLCCVDLQKTHCSAELFLVIAREVRFYLLFTNGVLSAF